MRTLVAALVMIAVSFWVPATRAADYPADNSGKNVRDRQESSKTPGRRAPRLSSNQEVSIGLGARSRVHGSNSVGDTLPRELWGRTAL